MPNYPDSGDAFSLIQSGASDLDRTSTECWQKNLNLQKGQETRHNCIEQKKKRERKGIRTGLAFPRGSHEGEREPTSWEAT